MDKNKQPSIELLAPAGDYECFTAAIHAGADAVYAGGERFGARAYAGNFREEELLKAIDTAHLYGRRFYLTVNTILKNNEISELKDYIEPLYTAGLDGVIVQDIGVVSVLSDMFPGLPLHASTQMAITDIDGVRLLKDMGISRVVPARELSLKEIKNIYEKTGMELECFIHGALCYSYSGKCLFSSIVGGRSGNRGRCAQPCRLKYNDNYLLSTRDISTLEILPELIDSGIASFKIEGRMKPKEYVAAVTAIYRKYIDRYMLNPGTPYEIETEDKEELEGLYTRSGHCSGYYHRHNGSDMITKERPSYSSSGQEKLEKSYRKYTSKNERIRIDGSVIAHKGEQLCIELKYKDDTIKYRGEAVERAKTHPVSEEDIRKHIGKLGDTCFEFDELKISSDEDIFMPVSVLNESRRSAVRMLCNKLLDKYRRERSEINAPREMEEEAALSSDNGKAFVNCRIDSIKMLDMVLDYKAADIITLSSDQLTDDRNRQGSMTGISDKIHNAGKRLFIALPSIMRNRYLNRKPWIKNAIEKGIADGVVIDNYEGLYAVKCLENTGVTVLTDLHLYAANNEAVKAYKRLGADVITYPVELNLKELEELKLNGGEFMLYGRLPMMISAQCTSKTEGKCPQDNGLSYIKDRYGNRFPCVRNCSECCNTILNCVPVMITSFKEFEQRLKPYSYLLHFTTENSSEISRVLEIYDELFKGRSVNDVKMPYTLGHLKRGVE